MKKLHLVFLFMALFSVANVASADTASDWWGANCSDTATADDYGVRSPVVYANVYTGVGTAENLAQVGETFTFMVRGPLKKSAELSVSDSGVTLGAKTCMSNNQPYPSCGQGEFEFKQDVTISGEPRDIVIKTTDGGVLFPGKTGPSKPVCLKVPVYRDTHNYEYSIELDKATFGVDEAFKVTLNGLTWLKANDMGSQIVLSRSNAPASSCEYGPNTGAVGVVCQSDGIISCGLLPDTSKPQYLCAATGLDKSYSPKFPNKDSAVTYTLSLRNTYDLFDTYKFIGGSKTITLTKYGENGNGGKTNYGRCVEGEGVNPLSPRDGCVRCQNIPNNWREHISTCGAGTVSPDEYKWHERTVQDDQAGWYTQAPTCAMTYPSARNGVACSQALNAVSCTRLDENPKKVYTCTNTTGGGATYHGKVVDVTGKGIDKVTVKPFHPTAAYMGVSCPTAETDVNGDYDFGKESDSICLTLVSALVDFKKDGYVDKRAPVGTEFDRRILPVTMERAGATNPSALTLLPSSATLKREQGSSVVFTLRNGKKLMAEGGLDVCYEIIKRNKDNFTPVAIDKGTASPTLCSWSADLQNWQGNSDWQVQGDDLRWVINYGPSWDIPGLQVMLAFRKHGTSEVTYATLNVPDGLKNGTATTKSAGAEEKEASSNVTGGAQSTGDTGFIAGAINMVGGWASDLWTGVTGFWNGIFGGGPFGDNNDDRYRLPGDGSNDEDNEGSFERPEERGDGRERGSYSDAQNNVNDGYDGYQGGDGYENWESYENYGDGSSAGGNNASGQESGDGYDIEGGSYSDAQNNVNDGYDGGSGYSDNDEGGGFGGGGYGGESGDAYGGAGGGSGGSGGGGSSWWDDFAEFFGL